MQRYLNHLLADLETATQNAPVSSTYRFLHPFDDEEGQGVSSAQVRYIRLHEVFELEVGVFPPSERLTKEQVTALLTAIEGLWRAWKVLWDCPPRLTARRRYTIMVERMEQDTVRYNYEQGATVNFCDRRDEGVCPFNDKSQCWCDELDTCARQDMEIWEHANIIEEPTEDKEKPLEEFRQWKEKNKADLPPWELFEGQQGWKEITENEDALNWLFFFDPQRSQDIHDDPPEPSPEDFEDFDWHSDDDDEDYGELPF